MIALALAWFTFVFLVLVCIRLLHSLRKRGADRRYVLHTLTPVDFKVLQAVITFGVTILLSRVPLSRFYVVGCAALLTCSALIWFSSKYHLGPAKVIAGPKLGVERDLFERVIYFSHLRETLLSARTETDFWEVLRKACRDLQLASVEVKLGCMSFCELYTTVDLEGACQFTVRGATGSITVTQVTQGGLASPLNVFLQVLQDSIDAACFLNSAEHCPTAS